MKRIIILNVCLLSVLMAFAQPGQGQRGPGQQPPPIPTDEQIVKMVKNISDDLHLDKNQSAELDQLLREHFNKVKQLTAGKKMPKPEEMQALKMELNNQLAKKFTRKQLTQIDLIMRRNLKANRPPNTPGRK